MQANRERLSTLKFSKRRAKHWSKHWIPKDSPRFIHAGVHVARRSAALTDPKCPARLAAKIAATIELVVLVDRYFGRDPLLTTGFVTTNQPVATHTQSKELESDLAVPGVQMIISGWS